MVLCAWEAENVIGKKAIHPNQELDFVFVIFRVIKGNPWRWTKELTKSFT
jgi:hypothetical protein